jgi:hypothetical protein
VRGLGLGEAAGALEPTHPTATLLNLNVLAHFDVVVEKEGFRTEQGWVTRGPFERQATT